MYVFAIETKGRSLEETAALFDGEDAVKELADRTKTDMVEGGHGLGAEKRTGTSSTDEKQKDTDEHM